MQEILKKYYGYDSFRDGQAELIENILNKRDVLGIMPTGGGKSICFQIPAIKFNKITLVVSPLISLMQDQVMTLKTAGVSCAYINSSLTYAQVRKALQNAKNYHYNIIYVAPERLLTDEFIDFAQAVDISMVTIDEAHCISQWGQDFRPSYAQIPEFIEKLNTRPVISAFTATATKRVSKDIIDKLKLNDPFVKITGFNRENLHFSVEETSSKFETLSRFLKTRKDKNGVIYCISRKNVESVCEKLNEIGYNATRYHAGLSDNERKTNQEDFLYDRCKIMVATNAFGMGIDKSDVSFVVHYNMPKDIESYYQEAGRAGRDGSEAECLLLYSGMDVRTQKFMIENSRENDNLDEETEQMLINQDLERLKMMTFYSTTNECLRGFILKYFNETPKDFCNKCSNCNTNFEMVDVTIEAQKIVSCVKKMGEKFGVSLVIEVLRGSKNTRVLNFGFDSLSTYGISEKSVRELNEIIKFMIYNDYLYKTEDEFPVIKWGEKASLLIKKDAFLQMKMTKLREKVEKIKIKAEVEQDIKPEYLELFNVLRELRTQIAKIKGVPPYVVFADKSLIDMCVKIPKNRIEFLRVYGVGVKKYEEFGERFLEKITEYDKNISQ